MGTYVASVAPFEAQLMTRIQAREEDAFTELYSHFQDRIYRTALRLLKEEQAAKDALQETFLNVFRAARHFRGDSKVSTWINRIAINVCLEMMRKNRRHESRVEEDISENTTLQDERGKNPFEAVEETELKGRIRRALARLGRKHRIVVRMHDLDGHTIKEIAEVLNVPEGTIKSRLFYGREEMKRRLIN
jgi:RNA polymerase sigma-70 factor (ECF subfamily)